MVLVRSGWMMSGVVELRPDSLTVLLVHWDLTTVDTLMMLVSDVLLSVCAMLYNYVLYLWYDFFAVLV